MKLRKALLLTMMIALVFAASGCLFGAGGRNYDKYTREIDDLVAQHIQAFNDGLEANVTGSPTEQDWTPFAETFDRTAPVEIMLGNYLTQIIPPNASSVAKVPAPPTTIEQVFRSDQFMSVEPVTIKEGQAPQTYVSADGRTGTFTVYLDDSTKSYHYIINAKVRKVDGAWKVCDTWNMQTDRSLQ